MHIEQFLYFFLMITVLGTLTVTGWYFITRGELEVMPDGSIKKVGKIFKGWYFFWTKEKGKKNIYYNEKQLDILLSELRTAHFAVNFNKASTGEFSIVNAAPNPRFDVNMLITSIEEKWEVKLKAVGAENYMVYKEYPDYVFPEIIRTPLAECATCFSSIYGSIFYWAAVLLTKDDLFAWSHLPWLAALFFWAVFCFSLSVLNTALAKSF